MSAPHYPQAPAGAAALVKGAMLVLVGFLLGTFAGPLRHQQVRNALVQWAQPEPGGGKHEPANSPRAHLLGGACCSQAAVNYTEERLQLPWRPLLTEEEVLRGMYYGSGARLRQVARKLLAGQPIKAFTLGGSVTYGAFVKQDVTYSARLFDFINSSFPHREHQLVKKGFPGTSSSAIAPCANYIIKDADLVVIEFSVNEYPLVGLNSPMRHAYEQLVRQLLSLESQPAVLQFHHYPYNLSSGDGLKQGLFYREPETQLALFAQYYDLTSVSVRAAVWHLLDARLDGFRPDDPDRLIKSGPAAAAAYHAEKDLYFYVDFVHPSPTGHQVLAELLIGPLQRALREEATGHPLQRRGNPHLAGMPPPMIPTYTHTIPIVCALMADFKATVKNHSGFHYIPQRPKAATFEAQKWGWMGTEPGAWVELEIDTRVAGHNETTTFIHLSHLLSYEHMGTADISCKAPCKCKPTRLDGTSNKPWSLFITALLQVEAEDRCRVRVTISDKPGQFPQQGHKIVLGGIMVAKPATGMLLKRSST